MQHRRRARCIPNRSGTSTADPFTPTGASEVRKATLSLQLTPRGERSLNSNRLKVVARSVDGAARRTSHRWTRRSGEKYVLVLRRRWINAANLARAVERDLRNDPWHRHGRRR